MGFSLNSNFKQLRMKNQIIIVEGLILLFVLGVAAGCAVIEIRIFQTIATQALAKILHQLDQNEATMAVFYTSRQITYKHNRGITALSHVSQFIDFFSKNSDLIEVFYPLEPCVTSDEFVSKAYLNRISQFCFQQHQKDYQSAIQNNSTKSLLHSSFGLFNIYTQLIDQCSPDLLQIADISPEKTDIIFPNDIIAEDYDISKRPWYRNHLKQQQLTPDRLYFFSPVFKGIIQDFSYQFTLTHSIFDRDKQFFALGKITFSTNDPSFLLISYNVLLINENGQVLYNGMEQEKNITKDFYIYDENITGFNKSDWAAIEERAQKNISIKQQSDLDIYNKYHKTLVHVESLKLEKENFTLIVFTNVSSFSMLEAQLGKIGEENYFWLMLSSVIIFGFGVVLLLITVIIIIYYICKPLVNITQQVSKHVLSIGNNINNELFKIMESRNYKRNIFTTLDEKFRNISNILSANQNRKSETCRLIEKMKYRIKESTLNINNISEKIALFDNIIDLQQTSCNLIKSSLQYILE